MPCIFPRHARSRPDLGRGVYQITQGSWDSKHAYHERPIYNRKGDLLLLSRYERDFTKPCEVGILNATSGEFAAIIECHGWRAHSVANQRWRPGHEQILCDTLQDKQLVSQLVNLDGTVQKTFPFVVGGLSADQRTTCRHHQSRIYEPEGPVVQKRSEGLDLVDVDSGEIRTVSSIEEMIGMHPERDRIAEYHLNIKMEIFHPTRPWVLFGLNNGEVRKYFDNEPPSKSIFVCEVDGTGLRYVGEYAHHPIWHHTDLKILCNNYSDKPDVLDFCVYDLEGGAESRPYENTSMSGHPSFSPCGRYFVNDHSFDREQGRRANLALYSLEQSRRLLLADCPITDTASMYQKHTFATQCHPVWSNDSRYILFNSDEGGRSQLYGVVLAEALEGAA